MKVSQILAAPLLLAATAALKPASLISTARSVTTAGLAITKDVMSKANIPAVLAVAAEKCKDFATDSLPQATVQGAKWIAANPRTATACAGGGVGLLFVAAPAVVVTPVLGAAGFGANGIVAGSVAAGVQSGIGNVAASGLFATLQSAGAGGYGAATVYGAVQVVGGAIASAGGALTGLRRSFKV